MAQITNFFLGANSGSGFQNLFSEIMDPETAFDIMICVRRSAKSARPAKLSSGSA